MRASTEFRVEKDSLGEMKVPAQAMYGPQTQRAVENFPVSGEPMPARFIHALGLVKAAAARVNGDLGLIESPMVKAIEQAAIEVAEGRWDAEFPIDVFQTGSGTSTNMNANEVIAHRAAAILGRKVHPNDHVNLCQSSNDVIPAVLHVSAVVEIERELLPALGHLWKVLDEKAHAWDGIIKSGRTHLMDATPIRLGQEYSGYASMVQHGIARVRAVLPDLRELAIGGTAVGTGLNTHPEFGRRMAAEISKLTGLQTPFTEAPNHFEAQGSQDGATWASGALNTVAASLMKIANDVRLMNSGPRCGLGEVTLPAIQPGSSIMPGKVNPVICEAVVQVGAQVMGNHVAITVGQQWGQLDLNTMLPLIARNLLESIHLLAAVSRVFADKALAGMIANEETCRGYVEISPSMATALNPLIGYDKAAEIAKRSFQERRPVRELAKEMTSLAPDELENALDPRRQTEPGLDLGGSAGG
jgi:fumarate hydratase class II